jgi:hypothetical protein
VDLGFEVRGLFPKPLNPPPKTFPQAFVFAFVSRVSDNTQWRIKGEYQRPVTVPAQLEELQSLLRKQGLGSALPKTAIEAEPPLSTGLPELDALLGGGLPRGEITECLGDLSAGCTTVVLSALAQATANDELAAYIDATDSLDPVSAKKAGVKLDRVLWVRCAADAPKEQGFRRKEARVDKAWRAANLVAAARGFGLIVIDLHGLPPRRLREWQRYPWTRLRSTIAQSPATILTLASEHVTASVAARTLALERRQVHWKGQPGVSLLLGGVSIQATLLHQRRRTERKGETSCRFEAVR